MRQIKNKKWLETVEQEEIYLRITDEDPGTKTTELIPTDTPDHAATSDIRDGPQGEDSMPAEEDTSLELDALSNRILQVMQLGRRVGLPSLKSRDRAKLRVELGKVNEAVKGIQTHNITELTSLLYAAAYATTERMGMLKERRGRRTDEPFWKRRVKRNIDTWRKDLSKIEEVRRGNKKLKQRERDRLNRKYHLEERWTMYVSGMLKHQKIKAGGMKVKRYDERCQQFKRNHLFRTNQKLFYETLDENKQGETALPDHEEATSFWKKIWSEEVSHNEKASWLEDVELEFSTTEKQADINITEGDIRSGVSKMANWKAAGPELVQGFWFKKLTGLHPRLQECLQNCVCQANVPEWMVRGRTVLIQKDPATGAQAS